MQYCVDHWEELNKLAKFRAQVSEVKNIMLDNIEKVIMRQTCDAGEIWKWGVYVFLTTGS